MFLWLFRDKFQRRISIKFYRECDRSRFGGWQHCVNRGERLFRLPLHTCGWIDQHHLYGRATAGFYRFWNGMLKCNLYTGCIWKPNCAWVFDKNAEFARSDIAKNNNNPFKYIDELNVMIDKTFSDVFVTHQNEMKRTVHEFFERYLNWSHLVLVSI